MNDTPDTSNQTQKILTKESKNGAALLIAVTGNLDFGLHEDFRLTYEGKQYRRYIINFKECEQIDSCGLGMLLQLQEHSKLPPEDLRLIHCPPHVAKVIKMSKFDRLFLVEELQP